MRDVVTAIVILVALVLVVLVLGACGDNLEPELGPDAGGDVDAAAADAGDVDAGAHLVTVGVLDVDGLELASSTLPVPIAPVWCEVRHELAGELAHVTAWFHSAAPGDVGAPVSGTFPAAGVYRGFGAAAGGAVTCRSRVR